MLTIDYCGSVSELTAILQYIHGESYLCSRNCSKATTILGIAMAEMIHLQKLGELLLLLGGSIDYSVRNRSGSRLWTPGYVNCVEHEADIVPVNIEGERAAIDQYEKHMRMIEDDCVNAVLARIIQDEEYHIMLLKML